MSCSLKNVLFLNVSLRLSVRMEKLKCKTQMQITLKLSFERTEKCIITLVPLQTDQLAVSHTVLS